MLSYAFSVLKEQSYRSMATESFENAADLCAAILVHGFKTQVKRGLGREYIEAANSLSTIRGRIDVSGTLTSQAHVRRQTICAYDEFSTDTQVHRVLKATFQLLLHSNISKARKKEIRSLIPHLHEVQSIDLRTIKWSFRFNRNNQTYQMLVGVCHLVAKGLLQTQSDGTLKMTDFLDERRMHTLYEKFILEYFRREHPELRASASQIPWALDGGTRQLLPVMQSDITLSKGGKMLIIDAKYYERSLQSRYGAQTLHSSNLYQIFTYVKNKDAELAVTSEPYEVSGMLLYAKTDDDAQPEGEFLMSGNRISVRTLDLNQTFPLIAASLDSIAKDTFVPHQENHQPPDLKEQSHDVPSAIPNKNTRDF